MLENKPWSLQCVNWNMKINKINLRNLFGLLREKKNLKKKKKICIEIGNGLLPIDHEAGRWARRWAGAGRAAGAQAWADVGAGERAGRWAQAGVQGAGRRRAWLVCGRARRACWRWAWAQARARQAAEARRRWGAQARGRESGRAAGRAGARLGARGARLGASARGARPAGTTGSQPVGAGWANWARLGFCAPGLVFSLVFRLGIFPESLNEHCSL